MMLGYEVKIIFFEGYSYLFFGLFKGKWSSPLAVMLFTRGSYYNLYKWTVYWTCEKIRKYLL